MTAEMQELYKKMEQEIAQKNDKMKLIQRQTNANME